VVASRAAAQQGVPPYPAPAPDYYPSAAAFVDYSGWRMAQLSARERALTILGRPEGYRAKRIGAWAMMGAGATTALLAYSLFYLSSGEPDDASDRRAEKIAGGMLGLGAGLTLGGLIWLYVQKHDHPYRDEIRELHREQELWGREQRRARRQVRLGLSLRNGLQLRF